MRSPPCRQSSVSLTAIHRDAFSSPREGPPVNGCQPYATLAAARASGSSKKAGSNRSNRLSGDSRGQHQELDACDGHNSRSSGSGGGPFSSFTRSPHRLFVRDLSGAQETAFEPLRLHLKPVSEDFSYFIIGRRRRAPADFIRQLGN